MDELTRHLMERQLKKVIQQQGLDVEAALGIAADTAEGRRGLEEFMAQVDPLEMWSHQVRVFQHTDGEKTASWNVNKALKLAEKHTPEPLSTIPLIPAVIQGIDEGQISSEAVMEVLPERFYEPMVGVRLPHIDEYILVHDWEVLAAAQMRQIPFLTVIRLGFADSMRALVHNDGFEVIG